MASGPAPHRPARGSARPPRGPRAGAVRAAGAIALGVALVVAGCARRQPPPDPAARAQALIEAGNAAYRAKDFRTAARRYATAAVVRPGDAAAYYGLGMALARLGRDEEARAAYAHARELARGADVDSLLPPR